MAVKRHKLGPGTLTLGTTLPFDASCAVNGVTLAPSKDREDDERRLCGDVVAGATTYTWTLAGELDTQLDTAGVVQWCWTNRGTEQPFEFTPDTAAGTTATGTIVVDPLPVGADESGAYMVSEFEFDLVGEPAFTFGTGA